MTLIAILLDLMATSLWWIQAQQMNHALFIVGIVVQVVLTLILLAMTFTYSGQRRSRFRVADGGYRPYTVRFAILTMSFVVNAILVVLYYLNIAGINPLIFTGTPN